MKAKYRGRSRYLRCILPGVLVAVLGLQTTTAAESTRNNLVSDNYSAGAGAVLNVDAHKESEEKETESRTKKSEPVKLQAGAASVLDADITLDEEALTEAETSEDVTEAETELEETEETTVEETEESNMVMAKVNEYVNIREDADSDAEVLGILYKDCGGSLIEQKDGWSKIVSGDVEGWVKDDYLYVGEEAEEVAKQVGMLTAVTTTETLRVRKDPDQSAEVYGLLAYNEAVEAISEEGDWVAIDFEGHTGYVSAEYVTVEFDIDEAESMETIKERERIAAEEKAKRNARKDAVMASATEADILAALIQCEAGGESYEGQVAVGAVVMNRVRSGGYPNSITDVIYASGQFSPASSGKMDNLILNGNIKASCRQAAAEVISGACNIGGATHFRRSGSREGFIIGNHVFW